MQLRFNGGAGAITCDKCAVIMMEGFMDYEFKAIKVLLKTEGPWYCKKCNPKAYKAQMKRFVEAVNGVASPGGRQGTLGQK